MQPVGRDDQVELLLVATFEADAHAATVVVEPGDAVAEAVPHPIAGVVVEDLGQVAAQDLELGGRTVACASGLGAARRGELRLHRPAGVDERQPALARPGRAHRFLDTRTSRHDPARAAHVHVLAADAQLRRPFHHRGLHPEPFEPVRQRGTGDAGACDEHSLGSRHR